MNSPEPATKTRRLIYCALLVAVLFLLLSIPESSPSLPPVEQSAMTRAFLWNQDARWDSLEASYAAALYAKRSTVTCTDSKFSLHTLKQISSRPKHPQLLAENQSHLSNR